MPTYLVRALSVAILALTGVPYGLTRIYAGSLLTPTLYLDCRAASPSLMSCTVSGLTFRHSEKVSITYRITFLGRLDAHHRNPQTVYQRRGHTDSNGELTRDPLRFAIDPSRPYYILDVTVVGGAGDRASISTSSATVTMDCTGPLHSTVSCRVAGRHFLPREQLAITYRVTTVGGIPARTYRRTAVTDGRGAFTRPPLSFTAHALFHIDILIHGRDGDRVEYRSGGMA